MIYTRKKRFARYLKLAAKANLTNRELTEFNKLRHCPDNPEIRIMEEKRLVQDLLSKFRQ